MATQLNEQNEQIAAAEDACNHFISDVMDRSSAEDARELERAFKEAEDVARTPEEMLDATSRIAYEFGQKHRMPQ